VAPLFHASANSVYWTAIGAVAAATLALPVVLIAWARTPYATGLQEPEEQSVKFDHRHHVRDAAIDCLYCHSGAESSSYAGVPPTSLCMGCHNQIWTDSPELAPVRNSYFSGTPLHWRRVNRLPDFVFFDHSIHVQKGASCVTCHGRVDEMGQVYAAQSLTMRFCLDCHRAPEKQLAVPAAVRKVTDCTGCHR
jgi:formate-dependent nitrite reductase cytochrome c552 subunit